MRITLTRGTLVAGRHVKAGETIDVPDKAGRLLVGMNKAVVADATVAEAAPEPEPTPEAAATADDKDPDADAEVAAEKAEAKRGGIVQAILGDKRADKK